MAKLVIIADDFTGALDSGVQFSARGADVRVLADADFVAMPDADVLVINAESRHMTADCAYQTVHSIACRALAEGAEHIYKKTDSALRGNIGAELSAVMDAANETRLPFIPAFPKMNRMTRAGVHYISGVPVAESAFGADPFSPVRESEVKKLIALQTAREVTSCAASSGIPDQAGIHVYDAEKEVDLDRIADLLMPEHLRISAGCAGFGAALAHVLGFDGKAGDVGVRSDRLFMVCGSVHPVTVSQIRTGVENGAGRVSLSPRQLMEGWEDGFAAELVELSEQYNCCVVDTDPEHTDLTAQYAETHGFPHGCLRQRIAASLGRLTRELLDGGLRTTLLCSGGDTLYAVVKELGIRELIPLCEILPGVILTRFYHHGQSYDVITKSGGFGEADILRQLINFLKERKEQGYAETL